MHYEECRGQKLLKTNSLKKIRWLDFAKNAISASTIAEYWFCPAKIYNSIKQGEIETPLTIAGSQIHEEEAQEILKQLGPLKKIEVESLFDAMLHSYQNLTSALRDRKILANSEKNVLFQCIVPEMGYIGVPDIADCTNGEQPILVETKTTGKLPRDIWIDNRIQMGVYLIGLESLSFKPKYGIVEYVLRTDQSIRKKFEIQIDDDLRRNIHNTSNEVRDILNGKEPVPCNNPRKCASCGYRDGCPWSL